MNGKQPPGTGYLFCNPKGMLLPWMLRHISTSCYHCNGIGGRGLAHVMTVRGPIFRV